jgi:hypothetical protein
MIVKVIGKVRKETIMVPEGKEETAANLTHKNQPVRCKSMPGPLKFKADTLSM